MLELSLKLILAHIIGDFVFQPDHWVKDKHEYSIRSRYMYWHLAVHTLSLLVLLGFDTGYWLIYPVIIVSHFLIDWFKIALQEKLKSTLLFYLDQAAHLVVIAMVVYAYHPYAIQFAVFFSEQVFMLVIALLLVTYVAAIIMKQLMRKWQLEDDKEQDSLKDAGKYIGMLERSFVFIFILLAQWQAIGFLIAAKSVFRFGDLSRAKDRKLTEYILIGSLLSFGIAILVGVAYQWVLELISS